jgi:hypothetical protein
MNLPPEPIEADLEGRIVRGFDRLRGITESPISSTTSMPAAANATAASPPTGCAVACGRPRRPRS